MIGIHSLLLHPENNAPSGAPSSLIDAKVTEVKKLQFDKNLAALSLQSWPDKNKYSFIHCVVLNHPHWNKIAKHIDNLWDAVECQSKWEEFSQLCFQRRPKMPFKEGILRCSDDAYDILRIVRKLEKGSWIDVANTINKLTQAKINNKQCSQLWQRFQADLLTAEHFPIPDPTTFDFKPLIHTPIADWPNEAKNCFIQVIVQHHPEWIKIATCFNNLWDAQQCETNWMIFTLSCFTEKPHEENAKVIKWNADAYRIFYLIYLSCRANNSGKLFIQVASRLKALTSIEIDNKRCNNLKNMTPSRVVKTLLKKKAIKKTSISDQKINTFSSLGYSQVTLPTFKVPPNQINFITTKSSSEERSNQKRKLNSQESTFSPPFLKKSKNTEEILSNQTQEPQYSLLSDVDTLDFIPPLLPLDEDLEQYLNEYW